VPWERGGGNVVQRYAPPQHVEVREATEQQDRPLSLVSSVDLDCICLPCIITALALVDPRGRAGVMLRLDD
jgi:hypothetical protein